MPFADRPFAPERAGQLARELAAGVDVESLVDRLSADAHVRLVREVLHEPPTDLLRRPTPGQVLLHGGAKFLIGPRFRLAWPAASSRG